VVAGDIIFTGLRFTVFQTEVVMSERRYDMWDALNLLEIAEKANAPLRGTDTDNPEKYWNGVVLFDSVDGWKVAIFYDCYHLERIAHFVTPDGEKIDIGEWDDSTERNILISWRGTGDYRRVRKAYRKDPKRFGGYNHQY